MYLLSSKLECIAWIQSLPTLSQSGYQTRLVISLSIKMHQVFLSSKLECKAWIQTLPTLCYAGKALGVGVKQLISCCKRSHMAFSARTGTQTRLLYQIYGLLWSWLGLAKISVELFYNV